MKKFAVIVAGGSGVRMGNSIPKQFLELSGKPVFLYSVESFLLADPDFHIILVVPGNYLDSTTQIVSNAGFQAHTTVVSGGNSRSASVKSGLSFVDDDSLVLIHDAARCLVSAELIRSCLGVAMEFGCAVPVTPVTDSVRKITAFGSEPLNRSDLRLVQTPQAFMSRLLKEAYELSGEKEFTDDASVLENAGIPVHLVEGESTNIKITRPADLEIAGLFLRKLNA